MVDLHGSKFLMPVEYRAIADYKGGDDDEVCCKENPQIQYEILKSCPQPHDTLS